MTRQSFLNEEWLGYLPMPEADQDCLAGRVCEISTESLILIRDGKRVPVDPLQLQLGEDDYWGQSVDVSCLKAGDVIVLKGKSLYLLSPNLSEMPVAYFNNVASRWSEFLSRIETFFEKKGFKQLRTPFLVPCPGVDHHIDFMRVQGVRTDRQWTLPTSPEIHLKKYLCQGFDNIFEIKSCFRDDLPSPLHSAEFTMLEWYRSYASLEAIARDLEQLIQALTGEDKALKRTTISECFARFLDFKLTPETSREELIGLARKNEIDLAEDDDWNDLFFRIMMEKIEPYLGVDGPEIVSQFPAQQASLSQIDLDGWSARFELYWQGVELANAYLEVNDPVENKQRFIWEDTKRRSRGAPHSKMDQEFFEMMEWGMPPASGIALGVDRLFHLVEKSAGS